MGWYDVYVLRINDAMSLWGFLFVCDWYRNIDMSYIVIVTYEKSVYLWIAIENHGYGWEIYTYKGGENYDWIF